MDTITIDDFCITNSKTRQRREQNTNHHTEEHVLKIKLNSYALRNQLITFLEMFWN